MGVIERHDVKNTNNKKKTEKRKERKKLGLVVQTHNHSTWEDPSSKLTLTSGEKT